MRAVQWAKESKNQIDFPEEISLNGTRDKPEIQQINIQLLKGDGVVGFLESLRGKSRLFIICAAEET